MKCVYLQNRIHILQRDYNANGFWEPSGIMSSNLQLGFLLCNLKCGLPGAFHLKWYLIELGNSSGQGLGYCHCYLLQSIKFIVREN